MFSAGRGALASATVGAVRLTMRRTVAEGVRRLFHRPCWLFEAELASGEVVPLMADWQTPALPIHMVSPPQRQHSAKVKAFGEFVRAALATEQRPV